MAAVAKAPTGLLPPSSTSSGELTYAQYDHRHEAQFLPAIRALISRDLSEPYSIYVYRYFLNQWAHLCYMVGTLFVFALECLLFTDASSVRQAFDPADS